MGRVLVKKNLGKTYLVSLSAHNHSLGEIECLVPMPKSTRGLSSTAQRRLVIARAADLSAEFTEALKSGLEGQFKSPD